jgi:hypothetical protein
LFTEFSVNILAMNSTESSLEDIMIVTPFESLSILAIFASMDGGMELLPHRVRFPPLFPGKLVVSNAHNNTKKISF